MLMIYAIGLRHSTEAINDQAGNNRKVFWAITVVNQGGQYTPQESIRQFGVITCQVAFYKRSHR
jgi:hypothetical protein